MGARVFVAAEVGFWHDPKVVTFAAQVGNPYGGAMILRLREFVLTAGRRGVLPKRYSAHDLAGAVGWTGKPAKLIKALGPGGAGVLLRRRGCFTYVDWPSTLTGWWENHKEADRRRKEEERDAARAARAAQRAGSAGDGPGTVRGQGVDSPRKIRDQAINQGPPGAPPEGGSGGADARWEWFAEQHPRLENPSVCRRYLAALSDAEWAHLQYALPIQARSSYWRKNPRYVPTADKYLREQKWLNVKLPKPKPAEAATPKVEDADELARRDQQEREERRRSQNDFLLAQLADPEIPEARKQKLRAAWIASNPDTPPPWEGAPTLQVVR